MHSNIVNTLTIIKQSDSWTCAKNDLDYHNKGVRDLAKKNTVWNSLIVAETFWLRQNRNRYFGGAEAVTRCGSGYEPYLRPV
jgi:hypothetical protein